MNTPTDTAPPPRTVRPRRTSWSASSEGLGTSPARHEAWSVTVEGLVRTPTCTPGTPRTYSAMMVTRPQTPGYNLADSPADLTACSAASSPLGRIAAASRAGRVVTMDEMLDDNAKVDRATLRLGRRTAVRVSREGPAGRTALDRARPPCVPSRRRAGEGTCPVSARGPVCSDDGVSATR